MSDYSYSQTRDFIGESLGDLSAIIRPDQWQKLSNAATELGLLFSITTQNKG